MDWAKFDLPEKWGFIHAAIGGGICFIAMFLISDLAQGVLERILIFFGVIGVVIYQEQYTLAKSIILFGSVYLLGGFCGGIYTGYKVKKGLLVVCAISGLIGFTALALLVFFLGQFDLSNIDSVNMLLVPLLGNVLGSYLGGFATNWPSEEETGETEKS